jgi:hypothetical protein
MTIKKIIFDVNRLLSTKKKINSIKVLFSCLVKYILPRKLWGIELIFDFYTDFLGNFQLQMSFI